MAVKIFRTAVFVIAACVAAAASAEPLVECYKKANAGSDVGKCLNLELAEAQKAYAETLAKAEKQAENYDRKHRVGKKGVTTAKHLQEASRSYKNFMERQCSFEAALMGAGSENHKIACRISLLRLRTGAMDNFFHGDELSDLFK